MKICKKCNIEKSLLDFPKMKSCKDGRLGTCKSCTYRRQWEWREKPENKLKICHYVKKWRDNNKDKVKLRIKLYSQSPQGKKVIYEANKRARKRLKEQVIENYGGKCACCGETIMEFLTIDHINGGGRQHKKGIGRLSGHGFYYWLRMNNYPEGFQVLCSNCNLGKYINHGTCPHKNKQDGREKVA